MAAFASLNHIKSNWSPGSSQSTGPRSQLTPEASISLDPLSLGGLLHPDASTLDALGWPQRDRQFGSPSSSAGSPKNNFFFDYSYSPTMGYKDCTLDDELMAGAKQIVMTRPLQGGRLGLAVKDCIVLGIVDPRASVFGWQVGDRVTSINGMATNTQLQFEHAMAQAVHQSQAFGAKLTFETTRAPRGRGMQVSSR